MKESSRMEFEFGHLIDVWIEYDTSEAAFRRLQEVAFSLENEPQWVAKTWLRDEGDEWSRAIRRRDEVTTLRAVSDQAIYFKTVFNLTTISNIPFLAWINIYKNLVKTFRLIFAACKSCGV